MKKADENTIITGAQWRDFYQNRWPVGFYIDDIGVNFEDDVGNFILSDDAQHKLGDFGRVGWAGEGDAPVGMGFHSAGTHHRHVLVDVSALWNHVHELNPQRGVLIDFDKAEQLHGLLVALKFPNLNDLQEHLADRIKKA